VNLIGEHTDYNEGFVLPMAIERQTVFAGERNGGRQVVLHSMTTGETATFSLREQLEPGEPPWSNYVRGVVAGFQQRNVKVPGFEAWLNRPFRSEAAYPAARRWRWRRPLLSR